MTREEFDALKTAVQATGAPVRVIGGHGGFGFEAMLKLQVGRTTVTRSVVEPVADVPALIAAMRAEVAPKAAAAAEVRRLVDDAL